MPTVTVAATCFHCSGDLDANLNRAEELVREAAAAGANICVLQEQFACYYFPAEENPEHFRLAHPLDGHPFLPRFQKLAAELDIVLPLSYFECCNQAFYNSLAIADADGQWVGHYRKHHIPDNPGYLEKYYFSPSHKGFGVVQTKFGKIGAMVCWDQWFPEAARACVLQGAEILTYPSAIGSEPSQPDHNSYPHWVRVQQGHAAANMVPLVASNRVGQEKATATPMTFHGGSFIAGPEGEVVAQVGGRKEHLSAGHFDPHPEKEEGIVTATFDLDVLQQQRNAWALFRDRRPDKYGVLCTQDGKTRVG